MAIHLLGQNNKWTHLGATREINFLELDAGDYQFQVKSCNSERSCNLQPKIVSFTIAPAPWVSWWAYTLYTLLLLSFIGYLIQRQREKLIFQKQQTENERRLVDELRDLNHLKDQFLANASHELRTPLNGIIGLCEILRLETGEFDQQEVTDSLETIHQCGHQLRQLVDDLLDFTQLQSHRLIINRDVFDLVQLTHQIVHLLQPQATEKKLTLKLDVSPLSIKVYADENRIRQVFYNLLNNALKFSDKGIIRVVLTTQNNQVKICVIDEGIGIDPAQYQKIFLSFSQIDGGSTRNSGGIGLGLAICKDILELHGSKLDVDSELGKGSNFSFNLPLSYKNSLTNSQ